MCDGKQRGCRSAIAYSPRSHAAYIERTRSTFSRDIAYSPPQGFEGYFGFAERAEAQQFPSAKPEHPARGGIRLDPAAPAAVTDPAHPHYQFAHVEQAANFRTYPLERLVEIPHVLGIAS